MLWLRIAALALVAAGLGLPINDVFRYALLLLATVPIFVGRVSNRPSLWLTAFGVVTLAIAVQLSWPAPRIDEGHNVFVVEGRGDALEQGLPEDAFRQMSAEFDARYPPERRCDLQSFGCWRKGGFPDRPYAFSADGIYDRAAYSRRVTGIDFSDPVWLRLGFINEAQYNWGGTGEIQRNKRNPWWIVLHPWRLAMPYFVVHRFPADFVGSQLCWQGLVLWEGAGERFAAWQQPEFVCRPIEGGDIGRRIFGVSIAAPLAIRLVPTMSMRLRQLVEPGLALLAAGAVLMLLVRWRPRQLALPFTFIGLSLLVVLLNDASFIGGVRPFDGGDDGLVYEGMARRMVQHALNGDFAQALEGGEKVFFYGGPGLRYFRAAEHFVFGDSFLGYLSLMLLLPFMVLAAFRRFFDARGALALTLIFIVVPVGAVFGTTFFQYAKWAVRGFADPAAATLFVAGFVALLGPTAAGPGQRFAPAFGAGLLFALALWLRPNLAPAAGILLGGAGLAALWQVQLGRVTGLCLGFLPVLGMALHNWIYGGVFVLFSANATIPEVLPMAPSAWVAALGELLRLDPGGQHVRGGLLQMMRWLAGPSESFLMVPLHAAAIAVLVRVAFWRRFDPWLRLTAAATLAQHPVAWFYQSSDRYYYLAWLMTLLVCAVWLRNESGPLLQQRFPRGTEWLGRHPLRMWLGRVLDWWTRVTGLAR
ncbi:MAG: hypothetical protein EXQ83_17590 [Xanthobacteraceae bacterium]|nr:hypothetical protein [Xanthobacteraceae bacterium]